MPSDYKYILYSFDVLDTVITRTTANPQGIFAIMERKLCILPEYTEINPHIRENFIHLRVNAEKMARMCFRETEEITLEDIYEALSTTGELTATQKKELMSLEILTEQENVIPIPHMVNRIRSLRERGERVIFISDMYLDKAVIYSMLEKAELSFREIPLYLSSEIGKTKNSGNLYKVVKERENVAFSDWMHIGDNTYSDIQRATVLGINAYHFEFTQLTAYENEVLRVYGNDVDVQLSIGSARNTRLINTSNYKMEFGCSIGGPMLYNYVDWVIDRSIEMDIKFLYFVARDGYVLKKIADTIISIKGCNIQTSYIYGSRTAWRIPSVSINCFDIDFVFNELWTLTDINSLAMTLGLEVDELTRFLPVKYSDAYYELSNKEIAEIKDILCSNNDFRDFICMKIDPIRKLVQQYLRQEIEWKKDNFAFVELRGTGKTMQCLADIVSDFWKKPLKTFYLELLEISHKKNCIQYNWMPSKLYLSQTVEILCRAIHGQTIGYRQEARSIIPILEQGEGEALLDYGYKDYINGVDQFAKRFSATLRKNGFYVNSPKIFLKYLEFLTRTPDAETLDFIGDMPFSGISVADNMIVSTFAPVLNREDIERIYQHKGKDRRSLVYRGSALELSEMRTSPELRKYIEILKSK